MRILQSKLFWKIILCKVIGTLFVVFIYTKLTNLGDAQGYLYSSKFEGFGFGTRTQFTGAVFYKLNSILGSELLVALVTSIFVGCIIWYCIYPLYRYIDKWLFWVSFLLPHFLVWSGYIGKEPIAIAFLLLFVKELIEITFSGGKRHYVLLVLFGSVCLFIRPHYFISFLFLAAVTLLIKVREFTLSRKIKWNAFALIFCSPLILTAVFGIVIYRNIVTEIFHQVMYIAQQYFLSYSAGNSNRYWINWDKIGDYFINIWWGVPVSIIGPTPGETLHHLKYVPIFIEGVISFVLIFIFMKKLMRTKMDSYLKHIITFGFIPAVVIILLTHYPFGLFNPGSAIRYKQALAPLLYFYPLLFMAEYRRAIYANVTYENTRKI